MIVDLSKMKTLMFRWAIGSRSTMSMRSFSAEGFVRFLCMAKTSILSFQRYFPKAKFFVFYNGANKLDYFHEVFNAASPSLLCPVTIIDAYDYTNPYPFKPDPGVWWKWRPFRFDLERTEIYVDTDVICLNEPTSLGTELNGNLGIAVIPDRCTYFSEDVCGNLWQDPILQNRIPVNCGFAVFKPDVTIEHEFYNASWNVQYGKSEHSYFLDEQGCFNIGLYKSNIPFALLSRANNIYAPELRDRLAKGVSVELCHFIADSKDLFYQLESYIFRKIYDQNYTQDDFFRSVREILDNYRYSGQSYGTST